MTRQERRPAKQVGIESQIGVGRGRGRRKVALPDAQIDGVGTHENGRLPVRAKGLESVQEDPASGDIQGLW